MLTVYRTARQLSDHTLFHAWLFKVARHAACRYFVPAHVRSDYRGYNGYRRVRAPNSNPFKPAAEFHSWIKLLEARERKTMKMRLWRSGSATRLSPRRRFSSAPCRGGCSIPRKSSRRTCVRLGLWSGRQRNARFARLAHAASRNHAAIDDAIFKLSRTVASRKNESEVALPSQLT